VAEVALGPLARLMVQRKEGLADDPPSRSNVPPHEIVRDLQRAAEQIPKRNRWEEAAPPQTTYERCRRSRRKGPQAIGAILVAMLARLGVNGLDSEPEAQGTIVNVAEANT
jgi:hypothetical protein